MRSIVIFAFLCTLLVAAQATAAQGSASSGAQPSAPTLSRKDAPVQPSPQTTETQPDLRITKLPNGLTVAIQKDTRFPLASLRLYVHAGSAYETPNQAGISHQLEHMVFKGTESRPKGAVATDIERAGGYLNAATSFDYTVYLTDMPANQWALGMDVLKDMAFHPSLDPQELESEKKVVLAERQRGEDSPGNRMFTRMQAQVLRGTPYERPIIGFPETIQKYTADGIRAYIEKWYQPQSMLLLVVGNVDPDAVLAEATRLFGDIANSENLTPPTVLSGPSAGLRTATGPVIQIEKTPWNKVHLSISFPGVDQNDVRAPGLEVLAHLLGGDKTSYLYRSYKYEKRLVDSISAASYSFERAGIFTISATLSPENLTPFWQAFSKDIAAFGKLHFTKQELDRAKLNLADDMYRQKETLAGYASKLGYFLFFGAGEAGEANYLRQVELTDQETLTRLLTEIVSPEHVSVTVLAPEKTIQAANAQPAPETKQAKQKQPVADKAPAGVDALWLETTLRATWPLPKNLKKDAGATATAKQEIIDLGQGRTLILLPDSTLPYAAADLTFTGGDSLIKPDQQGLATLTASLLTRGTKAMKAPHLEEYITDRAAAFGASSGRQTFTLSLRYPSRFSADMFGLLKDTLTGATMPEEELSRVKENQIAAIVSREDQPLGLAFRKLYPFLFGNHPYGFTSQGDKDAVAAMTRKDAAAFWTLQATQPWVLAVCGDFDREAVIAAAKALPLPQKTTTTLAVPHWGKKKDLTITLPDRKQAHLLLVFPGAANGSQDEAGLDLLQSVLAGQSGLLFRDLRDKQGLGYTVTAFQWQAPLTGAIIFYIGTEPDKMEQAAAGFAAVVKDLQETPLPEEELTRGKNQMRGDYVRGMQKISARSAEASSLVALKRPISAERDTIEQAQVLTPGDLLVLARKYLQMDKAYVVKVLP